MKIFDRRGEKIFETVDPLQGWNEPTKDKNKIWIPVSIKF